MLSDLGSTVYRREDACVTSSEYTSILVNWLQLLSEGKIVAKANIDWRSVIENCRLRWLQDNERDRIVRRNITSEIKMFVEKCIEDQFQKMNSKLDKTARLYEQLTQTVVELLKSADDVGQVINKKILKRKLRSKLTKSKANNRK